MKLVTALTAAIVALGSAGMYVYAQTRPNTPAAQAEPRDRNALERLRDWVMERGGTERAFANEIWDHHETGIYVEARTRLHQQIRQRFRLAELHAPAQSGRHHIA